MRSQESGLRPDLIHAHFAVPTGAGYLISTTDREAWISTLRALLMDPAKWLSMRQQAWRVAERFDLERVVDRYEEVFRGISGAEC
jgi:glycosyltransferase involved in cell wall biosynthesis